jgi:hypothetical protein
MTFLWMGMLWLLLLVPLLVLAYLWALKRKKAAAIRYANLAVVKQAMGGTSSFRRHIPPILFLASITVMLLATARPAAVLTLASQRAMVLLTMDLSGSMRAADIDPNRIVAAGHSNGAVLSIRLACELADQIVAVGFQAGTMEIDSSDPAVPVSMLHIHGKADENVPIAGGKGTKGISGVDWKPVIDGLRTIAAAQDCPPPETVADPVRPELEIQRWAPCADDTTIELVVVPGADHAWMGTKLLRQPDPTGASFAGFESSEAIWSFLAAHPRAA